MQNTDIAGIDSYSISTFCQTHCTTATGRMRRQYMCPSHSSTLHWQFAIGNGHHNLCSVKNPVQISVQSPVHQSRVHSPCLHLPLAIGLYKPPQQVPLIYMAARVQWATWWCHDYCALVNSLEQQWYVEALHIKGIAKLI